MKQKLRYPKFIALHAAILPAALLMPLYMKLTSWLSGFFGDCIMHRFFIYCPLCGGTRAVAALLRFDFAAAWNYNPYVICLGVIALGLDVWAWVRYFQKKNPIPPLPRWSWIALCCSLVVYFVLRNYLMIFHGIDPTGDLGFFWDAVRATWG